MRPLILYLVCKSIRDGNVFMQLTQPKVQKSKRITCPRRFSDVSGPEFTHLPSARSGAAFALAAAISTSAASGAAVSSATGGTNSAIVGFGLGVAATSTRRVFGALREQPTAAAIKAATKMAESANK